MSEKTKNLSVEAPQEVQFKEMRLAYFIKKGKDTYVPFNEYSSSFIGADGVYARHLCHYLVVKEQQYQLIWNEMKDGEDVLILEHQGKVEMIGDEGYNIHEDKVLVEFRPYRENLKSMKLLSRKFLDNHFEVMRYLLKDAIEIDELGSRNVDSFEIDEDRKVYVVYFEPTEEDIVNYEL